jgi:hypothetical protein
MSRLSTPLKGEGFFFQAFLGIYSLSLFFALIKVVNFFLSQMILPPIYGFPRIEIQVFGLGLDNLVLLFTAAVLPLLLKRFEGGLSYRLSLFNSVLSLTGLVFMFALSYELVVQILALFVSFFLYGILAITLFTGGIKRGKMGYLVSYFSGVFISIQLMALIHWVTLPFFDYRNVSRGAVVEYMLFMTPGSLTGLVLTLFLFSWFWMPVIYRFFRFRLPGGEGKEASKVKGSVFFVVLLIASIFVGYYPNLGRGEGEVVGIDIPRYYRALREMSEEGWGGLVTSGRLIHALIMRLSQILSGEVMGIRLQFPINAALIFLSTYLLFYREERRLILSSTLSIFSITNFLGGTIGLLSNWFALALWNVFIWVFALYSEREKLVYLVAASLLSFVIFFSHAWSWTILILIVFVFQSIMIASGKKTLRGSVPVFALILVGLLVRVGVFSVFGEPFEPVASEEAALFYNLFNPRMVFAYLKNISALTSISAQYTNFLVPALALLGMFKIVRRGSYRDRMVTALVMVCSVGIYASGVTSFDAWMPESHAWRFLFLIPYHIPAAEGLMVLLSRIGSPESLGGFGRRVLGFYLVPVLAAPLFHLLGAWSLLVVPFSVVAVSLKHVKRSPSVALDLVWIVVLALVNFILRGLNTVSVFHI